MAAARRRGAVAKLLTILVALLATIAVAAALPEPQAARDPHRLVLLAEIEGVIGPAAAQHVEDAIEAAKPRGARAVVLRIDTPGGLSSSTREIIEHILASEAPVVGYVAPPGGHAASAGTYILYATHVAAMAPGTNVGAATPVEIGGAPPEPPADGGAGDAGSDGAPAPAGDPMTRKAVNDAVAQIVSLAELRGRNAAWAERAVREAATASAGQALELGVIDLVAPDLDALLVELDGRIVTMGEKEIALATAGATVERIEPSPVARALGVLANPNIALILMLIGVYGIIFELANPGAIAPGVIGAIALVLGLYALNQLPLDYAGLALILLGVAFLVAEALTSASGVLGVGGIVAFIIGAGMLVDTDVPEYQLSWSVIGVTAALSAAFLLFVLGSVWRSHRRPPAAGAEQLLRETAEVLDWEGRSGHVWAAGERWRAKGDQVLAPGQQVRVTRVAGVELTVAPID